jgi:DNA-binding MarR family transcriptional regulator
MLRTIGLLERVMQPYFARFGITGAQWGVLRNLHRAEQEGLPGLRLTDLSERLVIRPPSVHGVVDRLERFRLVSRGGTPTDLRAKQVSLTLKGRSLVQEVLAVHEAQIKMVMGGLSPDEQTELHRLLQVLGKHLEAVLEDGNAVGV